MPRHVRVLNLWLLGCFRTTQGSGGFRRLGVWALGVEGLGVYGLGSSGQDSGVPARVPKEGILSREVFG